ncbi:unnamed protein product [Miscanthus lutarioriparius]|uniref:Uncharacterized protein n=1 Tax=Miscanthus lutarioriparius TaxID=422564 RepID=A0A811Q0D0_9POAL|nr:unnamed protein product [Miscanthus lutarioriparius]
MDCCGGGWDEKVTSQMSGKEGGGGIVRGQSKELLLGICSGSRAQDPVDSISQSQISIMTHGSARTEFQISNLTFINLRVTEYQELRALRGVPIYRQQAVVPIKFHVAGIAMGLVLDTQEFGGDGSPLILSDITGAEDASGDMDLKIAGNESDYIDLEPLQAAVIRTDTDTQQVTNRYKHKKEGTY